VREKESNGDSDYKGESQGETVCVREKESRRTQKHERKRERLGAQRYVNTTRERERERERERRFMVEICIQCHVHSVSVSVLWSHIFVSMRWSRICCLQFVCLLVSVSYVLFERTPDLVS